MTTDVITLLMGTRRAMANPSSATSKQVNAAIRKVVAERFVSARELNGYSQIEASTRMGYKNSAQLCQWEKAQRMPPIDRMLVASIVYAVSLDYLYGLSDEPERDPRLAEQQAMVRNMEDLLHKNAEMVAQQLSAHVRTGGVNMKTVKTLTARASEAAQAVRNFYSLNQKKFDNLRGGASLLHHCAELEALVRETASMVARHDGLKEDAMQRAAKGGMPLFDTPEYRQFSLNVNL